MSDEVGRNSPTFPERSMSTSPNGIHASKYDCGILDETERDGRIGYARIVDVDLHQSQLPQGPSVHDNRQRTVDIAEIGKAER